MALQSGTRLGPYAIAAQIGVGGMGEVYRATDPTLKMVVFEITRPSQAQYKFLSLSLANSRL